MRQPCLQCFRKHLGNAQVLLEEVYDGYPYWCGVIGHLDQAVQEIRGFSSLMAKLVRAHRIRLQQNRFEYDIPFEDIDLYIDTVESIPDNDDSDNWPEIPDGCYRGLEKLPNGEWNLYEGDQR